MVIRALAERPMIFALRFSDREIIDARQAQSHKASVVEFPVFIAIRAEPVSGIVVPLVGKAHCDAIVSESPKLLDQTIVQFF